MNILSNTVSFLTVFLAIHMGIAGNARSEVIGPVTSLHYTPNGHFNAAGEYDAAKSGFNVADAGSPAVLASLPEGVKGLVWVGMCNGTDPKFVSTLQPYAGDARLKAKLFGFYLVDEPDPTGIYSPKCTAANLKAESDWVHKNIPGAKTFFILMNQSSSKTPNYTNTYTAENTHVDLFGIDPYPCRTELKACDYSMITNYVSAVMKWGIPVSHIVPVYQTFGGGEWTDDGGGKYKLPTAEETKKMLAIWKALVPSPVFDYAYSWGSQKSDQGLESSPELQAVYKSHNIR